MFLKYGVEFLIIWKSAGTSYSPAEFVAPLLSVKESATNGCPTWVLTFILIWSIPFMLAALFFTFRRAIDIGTAPWSALFVLVPVVNIVAMIIFSVLPSTREIDPNNLPEDQRSGGNNILGRMLFAVVVSQLLGSAILITSVFLLRSYETSLFVAAPMVMGSFCGYWVSVKRPQISYSILAAFISTVVAECIMFLSASEGLICLIMAFPVLAGASILGGLLGYFSALSVHSSNLTSLILFIPAMMVVDIIRPVPPLREICTSVEIDVAPELVWKEVISFPEITERPSLAFSLGLAYPIRARIEGEGIGAVRYCEFSTGAFVEPITIWEPPHHLAFDVQTQPDAMTELSPYRNVHPPHLDGFMKSHQGEFRLIRLEGNRTRLEGRTWYTVDMAPVPYWQLWCDGIIHAIHKRVLNHIRRQAER